MASTERSIRELPKVDSINDEDVIVVQTENATNQLKFKDFVIGLENTTFQSTLEDNTTAIADLSTSITDLADLSGTVGDNTTAIETLSTQVLDLELSETIVDTLSVVNLSADNLTVDGLTFRGYPAYAQTIYNNVTDRAGNTGEAISIDLAANITLQSLDSRVKISFTVPGSVGTNDHTAALVLQYSEDGIGWSDIPDFLGPADGSSQRGTILLGGDASGEEGHTSTFTGIYEPTSLGTNNILYIRVALRLETGNSFVQNRSQSTGTNDATGVSVLLLEELFTS